MENCLVQALVLFSTRALLVFLIVESFVPLDARILAAESLSRAPKVCIGVTDVVLCQKSWSRDLEVSIVSMISLSARFRVAARPEVLQHVLGAIAAARDCNVTLLSAQYDSWNKRLLATSVCQSVSDAH